MQLINTIKQTWDGMSLWVFLGCLFSITPLYVPSTLDYLGKGFLIILLIGIWNLFTSNKGSLNRSETLAASGALFYALVFIASFFILSSVEHEEVWRLESSGFVLVVTLFYWMAIKLNHRKYFVDNVAISSLFGALLLLFLEIGYVDDFSTYRYSAVIDGSRGLAAIGFITPITAILFAVLCLKRKSRLYFLFFIVMVLLSGLNKSRTSLAIILPPLIFSFIYCLFLLKKISIKYRVLAILILAIPVITVSFIAKDRINEGIQDVNAIVQGNYDGSIGKRLAMVDIGVQLINKEPIFGIGVGDFKKELTTVVESSNYNTLIKTFILQVSQLHNQYIMTWILTGLIGLTSLLIFLFLPIVLSIKQYKQLHNKRLYKVLPLVLVASVFFGIGLAMLFGAIFTYTYTTIFFSFSMFAFVSFISQQGDARD